MTKKVAHSGKLVLATNRGIGRAHKDFEEVRKLPSL